MKGFMSTLTEILTGCIVLCSWSLQGNETHTMTESIGVKDSIERINKVYVNRDNPKVLAALLPIVKCSFIPSHYENILMTRLRDKNSSTAIFRDSAKKIGELLVNKVADCISISIVDVETPIRWCQGEEFTQKVDLVSVMRSGDALLDTFMSHFPDSNVSKILIQRDEATAEPHFLYMKFSPTLSSGHYVIITEPMIATGGTLVMVIDLLKSRGVKEDKIIIASVCTAPEGLVELNDKFPEIKVVMTVLDERLDERKYIIPGLGDFGDRYFGIYSYRE